jgi:hypothetical protein
MRAMPHEGRALDHFLSLLRDGDFVTRERARLWAVGFLVAFAAAILFLAVTAHGLNDYKQRPLGTDFSSFYAAGTLVLDGAPSAAFDPARHHEQERAVFGEDTPYYAWAYPPVFLLVAAPLAVLPYAFALIVWQLATLALYLAAIEWLWRRTAGETAGTDRIVLLAALAFPAVFVNLTHGQNGFLTAALFAAALATLDKRPVLAGLFFGLLAYKPQLGLLIPLVLAATGRWRSFAATGATIVALAALTTLLFGAGIWHDFLSSLQFARISILDHDAVGYGKMQSVFAAVRLWGGAVDLAYAAQAAATLSLAAALVVLWRSQASMAAKGAGLCLGTLLATPYCFDYDMMLLAPAIALLAIDGRARGFFPYERTALAALWLVPIMARGVAGATYILLGLIAMALAFAFAVRRGARQISPAIA